MNKKLIFLIVSLECVLAVLLVSVFGPMVESFHSKVLVSEISLVDDGGERMTDNSSVFVDLQVSRSFHYNVIISPDNATNSSVSVIHNKGDAEIEIEMDSDGGGFTVHFLSKDVTGVKITVRAKDSSQKQIVITLNKRLSDVNVGDDF